MRRVFFLGSSFWRVYLVERMRSSNSICAQEADWGSRESLKKLFKRRGTTAVVVGLGANISLKRIAIWTMLALFWLRGAGSNRLIFYWIGTDVLSLKRNRFSWLYARLTRMLKVQHICGAPWFVEELAENGIESESVLFPYDTEPAAMLSSRRPVSKPFKICVYLKAGGWDKLHGHRTLGIAAQTLDVQWVVMGMAANDLPATEKLPSNVTFTGWVSDPLAVQAECHAMFRLVEHDAFCGVVRDALAMGKVVLYSLPVSGVINIGAMADSEIAAVINDLASDRRPSCENDKIEAIALPPYIEQISRLQRALEFSSI